ncbi:unnamed protein product [Ectocarpus fasciculatus]
MSVFSHHQRRCRTLTTALLPCWRWPAAVAHQVSENPPEAADFDDDESMLFKCSGLSGSGAEASLRDKIEACRSAASARTPTRGSVGGGGTASATDTTTLTEPVVGMYIPTPADLTLPAGAAGLVA